jgi:hypothetical protein
MGGGRSTPARLEDTRRGEESDKLCPLARTRRRRKQQRRAVGVFSEDGTADRPPSAGEA